MKRTLLLTHEYYPYHGGVANYCYGLFSHLPEQNYVVATDMKPLVTSGSLLVIREDSQSGSSPQITNNKLLITTYNLQLIGKYLRPRWLKGFRQVKELCKKEKIEFIFTPNILPLGLIAEKIFNQLKIPYVLSLHGLDINLALKKDRAAAIRLLTRAQHVIVNSELTKNIISPLLPAERLTVITPYLNNELRATASEVKKIQERYQGKKIMLTVGRLIKRKNQAQVIKALHALGRSDVQYLIIGRGEELDNLRQLTSDLKMTKQVDFLLEISDEEIANYYAAASIFVMPTLNLGPDVEGYGIVYLDAAQFQLPIIASLGTSAEEILTHNESGLLIEGTSLEALVENIRYLLDNPEIAKGLGQGAFKQLQTLPDWQVKAQVLQTILS